MGSQHKLSNLVEVKAKEIVKSNEKHLQRHHNEAVTVPIRYFGWRK